MSVAYFHLYQRQIKKHTFTEEILTENVEHAHNIGKLTDKEYQAIVDLIDAEYGA